MMQNYPKLEVRQQVHGIKIYRIMHYPAHNESEKKTGEIILDQEPRKGFCFEGFFFCENVRISWLWRSECQMYCWAQCLEFVSLGMTLDSAETPFAKTPFSRFLI